MSKPMDTTTTQTHAGHLLEAYVMGPHAIEAQEARGQVELVNSASLPTDNRDRALLESWGIVFGEPDKDDPMFCPATLPAGWRKERTGHSMWSNLVDADGRIRAAIFYKAAFYDRSAHIGASRRFSATTDDGDPRIGIVLDGGKEVHRCEPIDAAGLQSYELYGVATKRAKAWLDERYPQWQELSAYWGQE